MDVETFRRAFISSNQQTECSHSSRTVLGAWSIMMYQPGMVPAFLELNIQRRALIHEYKWEITEQHGKGNEMGKVDCRVTTEELHVIQICRVTEVFWWWKSNLPMKRVYNSSKQSQIMFEGAERESMLGLSGPVVENPLANAGDMGSIPGLGRSHMLWGN